MRTKRHAAIARFITRSHHESTGAPTFAQIIFARTRSGNYYISGKAYTIPHLFVHGLIRAGRCADAKAGLVKDIAAKLQTTASIGPPDIWVYIQDIPATQMVEFGRILPEPGAEDSWRAGMSPQGCHLVAVGYPNALLSSTAAAAATSRAARFGAASCRHRDRLQQLLGRGDSAFCSTADALSRRAASS
jgi:phenylpyruvate tautomerase PptA (4-oxalocrotonate tautomerase family)